MTEPRHPLDGNMIAADQHYADGDDHPCTFCGGEGCEACDEWDSANLEHPGHDCEGCQGGDKWPANEPVWRCPVCDAEYYDPEDEQE